MKSIEFYTSHVAIGKKMWSSYEMVILISDVLSIWVENKIGVPCRAILDRSILDHSRSGARIWAVLHQETGQTMPFDLCHRIWNRNSACLHARLNPILQGGVSPKSIFGENVYFDDSCGEKSKKVEKSDGVSKIWAKISQNQVKSRKFSRKK